MTPFTGEFVAILGYCTGYIIGCHQLDERRRQAYLSPVPPTTKIFTVVLSFLPADFQAAGLTR